MFEIRSEHQKKDLGLRMLHEALVFLRGEWTLAVMLPAPITSSYRKWHPPNYEPEDIYHESTHAEIAAHAAHKLKIRKHICRMGFNQAGRTRALESYFFLTSDTYLPRGSDPAAVMDQWIIKENAGDIAVFVAPERQTPCGLDEELNNTLINYRGTPDEAIIRSILGLVERGASISGASAMHIAAANGESLGPPILRELVRLGSEVDGADENGNTPLHLAGTLKALSSIEYLLLCGASRIQQNDDGDTPLMCVQLASQNEGDFRAAMGMNMAPREMDIIPKYQSITLLMDQSLRTHLIEGWLSPRMREMLTITAELQGHQLHVNGGLDDVELFIPTDMRQVRLPAYFTTGLEIVFETVEQLLKAGRAPTVDRIKVVHCSLRGEPTISHACWMQEEKLSLRSMHCSILQKRYSSTGMVNGSTRPSKIRLKLIHPRRWMVRSTLLFSCV